MAGRASSQARPRGRHALRSRAFADELVRDAGVVPGTLALDLGAGGGMLTRALVDAGVRVRAVELDPAALRELRTRFGADPRVEVVEADASAVPLPDEPFAVVANLPFAAGTAILRRLLGDPRAPLTQLDAIVEWGLAAKRTAVWPSTLLDCAWGTGYELSLVRRVPRACFAPPPSVDAAVLRAVRRPEPLVSPAQAAAYEALLHRAFAAQAPLDRIFPRGIVHRAAHELGFDPHAAARDLDARQWARLYPAVRSATRRPRAPAPRRRRGSRR
ncbi:MAG TPA: rRNA adenine N(6)-methyltransferase family protein [Gaiellaceae bacterium]|nr:rRNA adenine N(6)-methyltransferase family protein [Gaiellaceae bacterium]